MLPTSGSNSQTKLKLPECHEVGTRMPKCTKALKRHWQHLDGWSRPKTHILAVKVNLNRSPWWSNGDGIDLPNRWCRRAARVRRGRKPSMGKEGETVSKPCSQNRRHESPHPMPKLAHCRHDSQQACWQSSHLRAYFQLPESPTLVWTNVYSIYFYTLTAPIVEFKF